MKVVAIIQARMGSTRLPGKTLKPVLEKPLLAYQLERVQNSQYLDEVLVATTNKRIDNQIISLCQSLKVAYFRGPEDDVLKRYYLAAKQVKADIVIRLTADCPLIDPSQIDTIVKYFLDNQKLQYVSNTLNRTFPRGMDIEVFSFQILKEAHEKAKTKKEREHVTIYMTKILKSFQIYNVTYRKDYSHYRWTVDTMDDFILIKKIVEELYPKKQHFTLEDIIQLMEKNSNWQLINQHVEQKKD
ncbi:cytidylyltransferase domain-containing protein [Oceanobacillus senegalensis]|uniref:cytidylyltransferase domain-containing protein n=1 Tax=Oceanobacillus senegalensis TaxID=1936063 RepID=UPI000A30EA7B|nr:glycosyltransferase family protein [Oceanobacillus senegalensis]